VGFAKIGAMHFCGRLSLRSAIGYKMDKIEENYQRIIDDKRLFDIRFWQSQGDLAIFEAVTEMLNDYFLIRGQNAHESRLQRTIENFRKA
jgi:hypothetical protein